MHFTIQREALLKPLQLVAGVWNVGKRCRCCPTYSWS